MLKQSEVLVRNYTENDLGEIIKLYSTFQNSPYVYLTRDENFIRYFLKHPEVRTNSMFVSVKNSQITGFAVIAIAMEEDAKFGNVIEFYAIDSQSAEELIQKIEDYCSKEGVDAIIIVPPPHLQKARLLKRWVSFSPNAIIVKCVSPLNLLKLLSTNKELKKRVEKKSVVFHIDETAYKIKSVDNSVDITQLSEIPKNELIISISSQDLAKIVLGMLSIMLAVVTGKVKVNSIRSIRFAIKLLNDLKITDAIYVSLGDLV